MENDEKWNEIYLKVLQQRKEQRITEKIEYPDENKDKVKKIKYRTYRFVCRKLNCGYKKGKHNIHHCFGYDCYSFVILNKEDHIKLHHIFGRTNLLCNYDNPEIKKFIDSVPHMLVKDKIITENTLTILTNIK